MATKKCNKKIYVFIDEIQNVRGWQMLLKKYYDLRYSSKFIVSGSSSSLIYKNSSESLAGRISFIDVFPLTFREFLQFNSIEIPEASLDFQSMERIYYDLSPKGNEVAGFLSQYLNVGGFPEWFDIKNEEVWFKVEVKYMSSVQDTDLKGILNFCKNFSVKNAYVVTKSLMEEREIEGIRVSFIPLWLFLLIF